MRKGRLDNITCRLRNTEGNRKLLLNIAAAILDKIKDTVIFSSRKLFISGSHLAADSRKEINSRFKLTNLAVGKRAVLLDLDRKPAEGGTPEAVELDSVALFQEPMELHEDVIEIGGLEGMLNVKNISDTDISGDIHIYYKYAAQDIYYGGITFRVRIQGGLKAGELRQIPAGHFDPKGCEIIQVTIYE